MADIFDQLAPAPTQPKGDVFSQIHQEEQNAHPWLNIGRGMWQGVKQFPQTISSIRLGRPVTSALGLERSAEQAWNTLLHGSREEIDKLLGSLLSTTILGHATAAATEAVPENVGERTKAGVVAAAPDVLKGTAQAGAGYALAHMGIPGLEPIASEMAGVSLGAPGIKRAGKGLVKGYQAFRDWQGPQLPEEAPPTTAAETAPPTAEAAPEAAPAEPPSPPEPTPEPPPMGFKAEDWAKLPKQMQDDIRAAAAGAQARKRSAPQAQSEAETPSEPIVTPPPAAPPPEAAPATPPTPAEAATMSPAEWLAAQLKPPPAPAVSPEDLGPVPEAEERYDIGSEAPLRQGSESKSTIQAGQIIDELRRNGIGTEELAKQVPEDLRRQLSEMFDVNPRQHQLVWNKVIQRIGVSPEEVALPQAGPGRESVAAKMAQPSQ